MKKRSQVANLGELIVSFLAKEDSVRYPWKFSRWKRPQITPQQVQMVRLSRIFGVICQDDIIFRCQIISFVFFSWSIPPQYPTYTVLCCLWELGNEGSRRLFYTGWCLHALSSRQTMTVRYTTQTWQWHKKAFKHHLAFSLKHTHSLSWKIP